MIIKVDKNIAGENLDMQKGPIKKLLNRIFSNKLVKYSVIVILFFISYGVVKRFDKISGLNYRDVASWAYQETEGNKPVDIFFVCPMVDTGKMGNMNMDYNNPKMRSKFVSAINMEKGLYDEVGNFYAPYYRQVTLPVYYLPKNEQEEYFKLAYDDVRDAFKTYMSTMNHNKPVILAGFSQGADMVIRLMKEYYGNEEYSKNLVAAYCIGWRLTEEEANEYPWIHPANGKNDTGCVVLFDVEAKDVKDSVVIPEGVKTYSINPLNWKTDDTVAFKKKNLGACFVDGDGKTVKSIPMMTGAYINPERGSLIAYDIDPEEYIDPIFGVGSYHTYDYQFFYKNIKKNVRDRSNAFFEAEKSNVRIIEN